MSVTTRPRAGRLIPALAGAVALALTSARSAPAQGANAARASLLVTPAWLASHLDDPDLVLIEVGDKAQYDTKHIKGAQWISLNDISVSDRAGAGNGLTLEVPPVDVLHERLASLGISDKSRIVVYYNKDQVTTSTRVMFTLDYAGFGGASSILDGGEGAWVRDGHSLTDAAPAPRRGTLSALRTRPIVVDAEFVKAHIGAPGVSIVDGRLPAFYSGAQTGKFANGGNHATGHIASAKNIPHTEITDSTVMVKPRAELAALFAKAGVGPRDTVIAYCHIGQQATAAIFAARLLGHPVLLYDGSFEDWSRHTGYPVENPSKSP